MKAMQCELCGGTDIVKDGDFFVCQNCGMKYTPESARKLMVEVEGVVEVKGEVSIDSSKAIQANLDMARHAYTSTNLEAAEEYADKVLALDQKNPEAWFIKSRAAFGRTTIADDRVFESLVCCKEIIMSVEERVWSEPTSVTVEDFELLKKMCDHIVSAIPVQYQLYANAFKSARQHELAGKILESLPQTLKTATLTLGLFHARFCKDDVLRKVLSLETDKKRTETLIFWSELIDTDLRIGEMLTKCATTINNAAVDASNNEGTYFEKHSHFNYYGDVDRHTLDEQTEFFSRHLVARDDVAKLYRYASELISDSRALRYIQQQDGQTWAERQEIYFKNEEVEINSQKTEKTSYTYKTEYLTSNKRFGASDSYIKKLDEELGRITERRESLEKDEQRLREQVKENAQKWWGDHPKLKEELESSEKNDAQKLAAVEEELKAIGSQINQVAEQNKMEHPVTEEIDRLKGEIPDLEQQLKYTGLFKFKEKEALKTQISERKDELSHLEQQLAEEMAAEEERINEAVAPYEEQKRAKEEEASKLRSSIQSTQDTLSSPPNVLVWILLAGYLLAELGQESASQQGSVGE